MTSHPHPGTTLKIAHASLDPDCPDMLKALWVGIRDCSKETSWALSISSILGTSSLSKYLGDTPCWRSGWGIRIYVSAGKLYSPMPMRTQVDNFTPNELCSLCSLVHVRLLEARWHNFLRCAMPRGIVVLLSVYKNLASSEYRICCRRIIPSLLSCIMTAPDAVTPERSS